MVQENIVPEVREEEKHHNNSTISSRLENSLRNDPVKAQLLPVGRALIVAEGWENVPRVSSEVPEAYVRKPMYIPNLSGRKYKDNLGINTKTKRFLY